ncbi:hypothetical protein niasHT_039373 [Heterodera trifolii]|uniref:Uncharacterized protein n=1 Tax=Heterodera trifolii TaxID=157864 RepID=A0ABD2HYX5_9BILA
MSPTPSVPLQPFNHHHRQQQCQQKVVVSSSVPLLLLLLLLSHYSKGGAPHFVSLGRNTQQTAPLGTAAGQTPEGKAGKECVFL